MIANRSCGGPILGVTRLHEDGEVGRHSGVIWCGHQGPPGRCCAGVTANVKSLTGEVNAKDALDAQIGRRMGSQAFVIYGFVGLVIHMRCYCAVKRSLSGEI